MFKVAVSAAVACLVVSAPAMAAQQLFSFTGNAFLAPSGTPIAALQPFAGATVQGAFLVDTAAASLQLVGPVGGQGQGALLTGAITAGLITINGAGGGITLLSNGNDTGNIFTVDNGGVLSNPNNRLDQMGYSAGSRVVAGSIVRPYDILGALPSDVFFGSLFFGRTLQGPALSPPGLITDVSTRDFAGVLGGPIGNPVFASIVFRQGNPNGGVLAGLPLQGLSIGNIQLTITNIDSGVPEPASWAMLIIGFGLTGATLRRRRALKAA
jgi:hypothetical protein